MQLIQTKLNPQDLTTLQPSTRYLYSSDMNMCWTWRREKLSPALRTVILHQWTKKIKTCHYVHEVQECLTTYRPIRGEEVTPAGSINLGVHLVLRAKKHSHQSRTYVYWCNFLDALRSHIIHQFLPSYWYCRRQWAYDPIPAKESRWLVRTQSSWVSSHPFCTYCKVTQTC